MANSPPTVNVLKFDGAGNVQAYPLLPTQLLDAQDGSDVGGGIAVKAAANNAFQVNMLAEFGNDRYAWFKNTAGAIYRKDQGGAGLWGAQGTATGGGTFKQTGLHVLHPGGVPTLACIYAGLNPGTYLLRSTDGIGLVFTNALIYNIIGWGAQVGMSIVFRDAIFFLQEGAPSTTVLRSYDLNLGTHTLYDCSALYDSTGNACHYVLHVHDNVLFIFGWQRHDSVGGYGHLGKLQAGAMVVVHDEATLGNEGQSGMSGSGASISGTYGHSVMFTDRVTGDLIIIMSGSRYNGGVDGQDRAKIVQVENATTTTAPINDISAAVMGAVEGADKYLQGGGSADENRRWSVFVDTESDPANPRTFLWTWVIGGNTECWEWKGVGAEMEAVASLAGISSDFALPHESVGGGFRSPRTAAISIGDPANPPASALGGTKIFFRAMGSAGASTFSFRGGDKEVTPDTIIPIVAASLVVESGAPATTPTISGNTITNITPDLGVALYSVILEINAAGVDIDEGDVGLIIPGDLV